MKKVLFVLLAWPIDLKPLGIDTTYPIKVSPSRRYLVDRVVRPFVSGRCRMVRDPWPDEGGSGPVSEPCRKGFNTSVNLIEHMFKGPTNRYGDGPPRPALLHAEREILEHADWVIRKAGEKASRSCSLLSGVQGYGRRLV
jgi:hypothetical protein